MITSQCSFEQLQNAAERELGAFLRAAEETAIAPQAIVAEKWISALESAQYGGSSIQDFFRRISILVATQLAGEGSQHDFSNSCAPG